MLKRVILMALMVAGVACSAVSNVRIDIYGDKDKVELKPGKASKLLTIANPAWAKENQKYRLTIYSTMNLSDKWQKFTFSFTPEADGKVVIYFRGQFYKPEGAKKNIESWTAYDNITVAGTEAKNSDFEFVDQKNLFDGWTGNPANMVTGPEQAQSGKNYIIVWHNSPVLQTLKLKKGEKVTITFYAKASEGPVKKTGGEDSMDNI